MKNCEINNLYYEKGKCVICGSPNEMSVDILESEHGIDAISGIKCKKCFEGCSAITTPLECFKPVVIKLNVRKEDSTIKDEIVEVICSSEKCKDKCDEECPEKCKDKDSHKCDKECAEKCKDKCDKECPEKCKDKNSHKCDKECAEKCKDKNSHKCDKECAEKCKDKCDKECPEKCKDKNSHKCDKECAEKCKDKCNKESSQKSECMEVPSEMDISENTGCVESAIKISTKMDMESVVEKDSSEDAKKYNLRRMAMIASGASISIYNSDGKMIVEYKKTETSLDTIEGILMEIKDVIDLEDSLKPAVNEIDEILKRGYNFKIIIKDMSGRSVICPTNVSYADVSIKGITHKDISSLDKSISYEYIEQ